MNALNINFSLLPTKFLQPVNVAEPAGIGHWPGWLTIVLQCRDAVDMIGKIVPKMTCNVSSGMLDPTPHLLSHFLASKPSPHWKSQIAHSDMHHPVSGINSLIHSVSLTSHISTHLLIHLSAHLYYHHHSHHPSLFHSRLKPTSSTNPSHLNT